MADFRPDKDISVQGKLTLKYWIFYPQPRMTVDARKDHSYVVVEKIIKNFTTPKHGIVRNILSARIQDQRRGP